MAIKPEKNTLNLQKNCVTRLIIAPRHIFVYADCTFFLKF